MHGSDPPACSVHAGRTFDPEVPPEPVEGHRRRAGAPHGNQNARAHGFYSSAFDPQEIADLITYADDLSLDDEIACARVALRRILVLLDFSDVSQFDDPADAQPMTHAEYARLMSLALQAARTIARLLRDQHTLSGSAADGITGAIGTALDELSTIWGVRL
jgi:hypothetical protein